MKKIKITKEQYNAIAKLLKEEVNIPNMGKKVDKSFKQAFTGKNVENLKEDGTEFKIEKPLPKMSSSVQGKFMKEGESDLKHETLELIKYLYRKSEEFSPFWAEHDLTYDDICDALESKGIIIKKDGKYELSKTLGSAEKAKQAVEDELSQMIGGGKKDIEEYDNYNYPMGADADPNAPWNQKDPSYSKASINTNKLAFEGIYVNNEIAILKDKSGSLFAFYYDNVPVDELDSIAYDLGFAEEEYVGKDEDGMPDFEYHYNWQDDDSQKIDVLATYADSIANEAGEGLEDWENGVELVKIDDTLKNELLDLYDKDSKLTSILSGVNEMDMGDIKSKLAEPFKQQPSGYEEKSPEEKEMIKQRLAAIRAKSQAQDAERFAQRDAANAASSKGVTSKTIELPQSKNPNYTQTRLPFDETTSAGAIGGGTSVFGGGGAGARLNTPVGKFGEPLKRTFKEELNETTQGEGSIGQYDANALPIGRNGEFKKVGKTKAETTPQWAGGAFVDFNDCTKLNNKPAGSGCSAGAVDNVVKLRKAKGSVNAPSLSENKIYETIAKKTGKSIEEVKRIIETKKNK